MRPRSLHAQAESPAAGPRDGPLLARAQILERYPLERETFFDCRIAGQIWKGVVPPGAEDLEDGLVRLAADKVFYFAPDGARLRVS